MLGPRRDAPLSARRASEGAVGRGLRFAGSFLWLLYPRWSRSLSAGAAQQSGARRGAGLPLSRLSVRHHGPSLWDGS